MFVIARDRRAGRSSVHYLPDGGVVSIDDATLLARMGDTVIVQTGRDKYTVNAPGSVNMTERVLHFVPFHKLLEPEESGDVIDNLRRLEEIAWSEEMPDEVRRFVRLYAALYGLKILDKVPASFKESVALTVSRLSGEPIGKLISEKEAVMRNLQEELENALRSMRPEHLNAAVNAVIAV